MIRTQNIVAWLMLVVGSIGCAQEAAKPGKPIGGGCDGCELMFEGMPEKLDWQTVIAGKDEAGEPLEIHGVIYQSDGKTPADGTILYVYHTDAKGEYSAATGQTHARIHGHLRGWMKTGKDGRYKFRTIRPAPYPSGTAPAHIHPVVKEPQKNEYWVDAYLFDDDPHLTKEKRAMPKGRGGLGIIELTKDADGMWIGRRDIILGRDIPDYR
jgi:protocatechuate 3,4-dioxygenase, beta subunit